MLGPDTKNFSDFRNHGARPGQRGGTRFRGVLGNYVISVRGLIKNTSNKLAWLCHSGLPSLTVKLEDRNLLIEQHLPMARRVAGLVYAEVGHAYMDVDELLALGIVGLLEAAHRYEPEREVTFATFAYPRIRGAMFDGIRHSLVASLRSRRPRRLSSKSRGQAESEQATGGSPDSQPDNRNDASHEEEVVLRSVSLEAWLEKGLQIADHGQENPYLLLARYQLVSSIPKLMEILPERERYLIEQCYFEGKSLREIGDDLGLTRSGTSRLHGKVLTRLRRHACRVGLVDDDSGYWP